MEEKRKILIAVLAAVVIFVVGTAVFLGIEKLTGVKGSRKIPNTAGQGAAQQTNTARQEAPEEPADGEGEDPAAGTAAVSGSSGTGGDGGNPADTAAQEAQNSLLGYEAAQEGPGRSQERVSVVRCGALPTGNLLVSRRLVRTLNVCD